MSKKVTITQLLIILTLSVFSQIQLPKLISPGMVLQRNQDLKIWGWSSANENIVLEFNKNTYNCTANNNGEWQIELPKQKAGGPFLFKFIASDTVLLDSIYFGDVWLCSGQSNMELNMKRVSPIYGKEIKEAMYPEIRYFYVPRKYDFNTQRTDLSSGEWKPVTPQNVLSFSAVSYFFGLELYKKYNVPIGLINSALGGSPIESWIDEEHLKNFPEAFQELQKFKDQDYINKIKKSDLERNHKWHSTINKLDKGYKNPDQLWKDSATPTTDWNEFELPGYFPEKENGVIWVKRDFTVPEKLAGKQAKLDFGCIIDADSIYVNGTFIGNTTYLYPPRRYTIPESILTTGINTIAIRVISRIGQGGFVEDKAYEIRSENEIIDLKGKWKYKYGIKMDPLQPQTFIRWKPAGLYNAMIAPLTNYSIKGALWYQGESNTHNALEYRNLLKTMIINWRLSWNDNNLPVIIAQLPNFMEAKSQPEESNWALLRESQLKVLELENTALTVNIDLGEWNDIHPLNKLDVSKRLALAAQKIAYNEPNLVHSGPIFKSYKVVENKIEITFSNTGSGLKTLNGKLQEFAISSEDKKFVWAKAKILDNKVIVWSDDIKKPVAVRYAWSDNPNKANLFNNEGLPASPFRTDEW